MENKNTKQPFTANFRFQVEQEDGKISSKRFLFGHEINFSPKVQILKLETIKVFQYWNGEEKMRPGTVITLADSPKLKISASKGVITVDA